jgi:hypothetical protein
MMMMTEGDVGATVFSAEETIRAAAFSTRMYCHMQTGLTRDEAFVRALVEMKAAYERKEEESFLMIQQWYAVVVSECGGICPSCGEDLSKLPLEANLYPHYTAGCRTKPAK